MAFSPASSAAFASAQKEQNIIHNCTTFYNWLTRKAELAYCTKTDQNKAMLMQTLAHFNCYTEMKCISQSKASFYFY
jgi:hypothetical protein